MKQIKIVFMGRNISCNIKCFNYGVMQNLGFLAIEVQYSGGTVQKSKPERRLRIVYYSSNI